MDMAREPTTHLATLHSSSRRWRCSVAGCGRGSAARRDLPKPLIVPTPAKVGVVVTAEAGNYIHKESRASVNYEAQLGASHRHLIEEIFRAEFTEAKMFDTRRCRAARARPAWPSSSRASSSSRSRARRKPAASIAR